jgi:alpha-D-xyloside xylohydrolase
MVMDFSSDTNAVKQPYEYMFGEAILVAPITEAVATQRDVYLPESNDWYDFWTSISIKGGQTIKTEAPLDKIPLFIKVGSIIPFGPEVQFATEKNWDNLEIRIYPGTNGEFTLYEDENDNYNYEKGICSTIQFSWNDSRKVLTIYGRQGSFPGMLSERNFNIICVTKNKGTGIDAVEKFDKAITYKGKKVVVQLY